MDKNFSFKTISVPFTDFYVNVIANYDEHLTKIFGDYMTPVDYGLKHINTFEME
jgi:phosphorylcholine metabolism protein LicD